MGSSTYGERGPFPSLPGSPGSLRPRAEAAPATGPPRRPICVRFWYLKPGSGMISVDECYDV